jgi:hypothetical protein
MKLLKHEADARPHAVKHARLLSPHPARYVGLAPDVGAIDPDGASVRLYQIVRFVRFLSIP